ncbi:MAG: hypothetical protein DCC88_06055 [Spirobacillus cienkowskii]|jgi:type IV pilus assembly protein PilM|uniref:SHS2 domain-containing protein n=1 Tax=Spirobacillus cienkowskii TaxID=495820 RepID=A0A369KR58_9BACT|nr:MAG: hypothetical protein DCC88_06055 [Spirobacillus cienkowskii]
MQKILGLDIGSYSVKATILWNDFKNFTVKKIVEQKIDYKEGVEHNASLVTAIDILIHENQLEYDVVYAALDSRSVSIRKVDFENIRKRDILGFLENELESTSPFDMEETILDYQIIKYSKTSSAVLAVLCQKSVIKNFLDAVEKEHLRVKVLDIDNLSYLNMSSFLKINANNDLVTENKEEKKEEEVKKNCFLIANIGHSKTTLTFINDNNVLYTRIINIGGLYFNQVLKNRFDISIEEAESLKCFVSSILINDDEFNNNKENMVAQVLNEAVTELGLEILRTIQAFVAKENLNITSIFLTGGSSKIAGIDSVFQELLGISVSFLLIQEDKILFDLNDENIKNSDEIAKNLKVFSQSIAISMRGLPIIKEISKINFRKGEFAQISNYDKLIKQIFLYSSIVAIVLVSLMLSYFFRYFMYNKEINDLKTNFRRDIISLFSGEPASLRMISGKKDWDFINYGKESLILLQENMSDKKLFLEQFSSSETPLPLKIMNQVSQSIPSTMYFEVSEFRVQDNQFYIEAETNDPENIKKIINILSKINLISNVTKKSQSVKVGTDKKITHFSLVANVVER